MANLITVEDTLSYCRVSAGSVRVNVKWGVAIGSPQLFVDGVLKFTWPATVLLDFSTSLTLDAGEHDVYVVAGQDTSNTVHVSAI